MQEVVVPVAKVSAFNMGSTFPGRIAMLNRKKRLLEEISLSVDLKKVVNR